jgi:hypothetical protein
MEKIKCLYRDTKRCEEKSARGNHKRTKDRRRVNRKFENKLAKQTLGGMIASLAGGCVVC